MRYGSASVSTASGGNEQPSGDSFDSFDSDFAEGETAPKRQAAPPPPQEPVEDAGPSASSGFLWGLFEEPDWMLLGGSLRSAGLLTGSEFRYFPMQADLYGQLAFGPAAHRWQPGRCQGEGRFAARSRCAGDRQSRR